MEIIVVDNNTDPAACDRVRAIADDHGCRYVHEPTPGAGAARNSGAAAGSAPVLVFVDDDMIVDRGFVQSHLDAHAGAEPVAAIGPVEQLVEEGRRFSTYLSRRAVINREPDPLYPDPKHFYGANSSVDRTTFAAVGGFDPAFLRRQDGELGLRLAAHGVRFVVAEEARARHRPVLDARSWLRRCRRDGFYLAMLVDRHPEIARTERVEMYSGWRPVVAALVAVPLVLAGSVLYPVSKQAYFRGLSAASLVQSARGVRSYRRGGTP